MNPTELEEIKKRADRLETVSSEKWIADAAKDREALIQALEEAWAERDRLYEKYNWQLLVKRNDELNLQNNLLLEELGRKKEERDRYRSTLITLLKFFPKEPSALACLACDMGGAGYSSKGDGYHDDHASCPCAYILIQRALQSEKKEPG